MTRKELDKMHRDRWLRGAEAIIEGVYNALKDETWPCGSFISHVPPHLKSWDKQYNTLMYWLEAAYECHTAPNFDKHWVKEVRAIVYYYDLDMAHVPELLPVADTFRLEHDKQDTVRKNLMDANRAKRTRTMTI
jgi:hypothetical protein